MSNAATPAGTTPTYLMVGRVGTTYTAYTSPEGTTWTALAAVAAEVTAQQATNSFAEAGVMLRASTDPGSPYYAALITPSNGIRIRYRSVQGGGMSNAAKIAGTVPFYLKVARAGNTFTAYTSPDGVTWTAVAGSSRTLTNLAGPVLAGLAVCSHTASQLSQTTMTAVSIG